MLSGKTKRVISIILSGIIGLILIGILNTSVFALDYNLLFGIKTGIIAGAFLMLLAYWIYTNNV